MRSSWTWLCRTSALMLLFMCVGCSEPTDPVAAPDAAASVAMMAPPQLLHGFFRNPQGNGQPCYPSDRVMFPENAHLQSAQWIGAEGGEVVISGLDENDRPIAHRLAVPAGVVSQNTLFCIRLSPRNHMQVQLTAYSVDAHGTVVDVGGGGFGGAVYLYMTFANAHVPEEDTRRVTIVHDPDVGPAEPMFASQANSSARAELRRLSKYALALD